MANDSGAQDPRVTSSNHAESAILETKHRPNGAEPSSSLASNSASSDSSTTLVRVAKDVGGSAINGGRGLSNPQVYANGSPVETPGDIGRARPMVEGAQYTQSYDQHSVEDDGWHMRHGWDSQYSAEQLSELTTNFYMYFNDKRHETSGNPKDLALPLVSGEWRMRDRLKTVAAVLAICLNIGVDPPDIIRTNPCARLECWINPTDATANPSTQGAMNNIGKALQAQYEQLSIRTRYKLILDPTVEECKRYCQTLRKTAKEERILFHYNGHGVPKPTPSGEIWVFNKNYTQYIPISLYDLQAWVGTPSLFVYDCSDAGIIIKNFKRFAEKHEQEMTDLQSERPAGTPVVTSLGFGDCIHLAACAENENLPTNPNLPADLFTCCLTTPIEIAVRFFVMRNPLPSGPTIEEASKIPGRSQERRTPLGELNWIFTAITDTIAWNSIPKPLFKKLFRQDLMVAALFRNYLLAQRVMRFYHCHPVCEPVIKSTHDHPLWNSWDLAVEMVLSQLRKLHAAEEGKLDYTYKHSDFFTEQLTAFEVYLQQDAVEQKEPEQLPIVLQVLLSQVHRLRALILLSKFLDLGPWAVNLALGIGIFPYVLKLLQSQAVELKPVMIFIWARILAVDSSCQGDLLKDNGYQYFVSILNPVTGIPIPVKEVTEHRAMCAFIIAMFCKKSRQGQMAAHSQELIESCLNQISWTDWENPLLRQWCCLCLSMLWENFTDAKWTGIRCSAHVRLCEVALDPVPEVRAAMLHALTNFLGIPEMTDQVAQIEEDIASGVLLMTTDGSTIVRKELVVFFSAFVARHRGRFIVTAFEQMAEEIRTLTRTVNGKAIGSNSWSNGMASHESESLSEDTVFASVWKHVLILSVDPAREVARNACIIVDSVFEAVLHSPLGPHAEQLMSEVAKLNHEPLRVLPENARPQSFSASTPDNTSSSNADGYFSLSIKRTASVAVSLRNLAFGNHPNNNTTADISSKAASAKPMRQERAAKPSRTRSSIDWTQSIRNELSKPPSSYKSPKRSTSRERVAKHEAIDSIPLQSTFFEWSSEYFREPQMKQTDADEPGSLDYNQRLWRRNRNERILETTQKLKEQAGTCKWDNHAGYFSNESQPLLMYFHQYESHLIVADDRSTVRIWDWNSQSVLNRFTNGNPPNTKITGVRFINEDDQALLMTGSSDGVIQLYRNYESSKANHVISAFRALTDLVPNVNDAGLVFDWLQGRGWILVAGDAKTIRVWNAASEVCTNEVPARSSSCVTSLTSDQVEGHIFVAGFGNGAVRVYDQRLRPIAANLMTWKEHKGWITNVHMQRGGQRELVSGSRDGEVKLWDIRMGRSLRTMRSMADTTMRSLSVHEHAPVIATGSENHRINVYNMDGSKLSSFDPMSTGTVHGNRNGPIATTTFHPHRMMLACAQLNDNHVNLFQCGGQRADSWKAGR